MENPYFQAFCGETWFRHCLPLDRSSMTRWRRRIGPERLEAVLAETIAAARRAGAMGEAHARRVTIDTTVQTKAVAHPTDSHLLHRGVEWLVRLARRHGVRLRQSFVRLAAHARREAARLMHGPGHAQALRHVRRLRTFLGRLHRDAARKLAGRPDLEAAFATAQERVARLARRHGVALRQSFVRLAAHARREAARLMHGPGHRQALRHVRRLRTFLGRLHRDVGR